MFSKSEHICQLHIGQHIRYRLNFCFINPNIPKNHLLDLALLAFSFAPQVHNNNPLNILPGSTPTNRQLAPDILNLLNIQINNLFCFHDLPFLLVYYIDHKPMLLWWVTNPMLCQEGYLCLFGYDGILAGIVCFLCGCLWRLGFGIGMGCRAVDVLGCCGVIGGMILAVVLCCLCLDWISTMLVYILPIRIWNSLCDLVDWYLLIPTQTSPHISYVPPFIHPY